MFSAGSGDSKNSGKCQFRVGQLIRSLPNVGRVGNMLLAFVVGIASMTRTKFRTPSPVFALAMCVAFMPNGSCVAGVIGFDIALTHNNAPTAAEQAAFDAAEATWESLISGFQDTLVDTTLEITTNLAPDDGLGGTLGSAGPTTVKAGNELNFGYAGSGVMNFDTADTANLALSGLLDDVILHEMGHVLGIGTLWNMTTLGLPVDPWHSMQNYYTDGSGQYTGPNALAAWQGEFGQTGATFMPVELGGGAGTANGHWNEVDGGGIATGITSTFAGANFGKDFQNEVMTGWIGSEVFISNVTLGGLVDLGYTVPSFTATAAVPESSSFALLGIGAIVGMVSRRRRRQAHAA